MTITTISSREFNQDTSRAKKAASEGPVFITDRGKPAHVLLSIEDYQRIMAAAEKSPTRWRCPVSPTSSLIRPARDPHPAGRFLLMFVLDTNVVSELRKIRLGRADRHVTEWADSVDAGSLYISAITILELEVGILQIERKDPRQGAVLRTWLDSLVLPEFDGRIFPIDTAVAQRCARLHVSDPRAERDALIAATALVHGMTVVTRNVADFEATGVPLLNPWDAPK